MTPDDVREVRATLEATRGTAAGFDICIGGANRNRDWEQEKEHIRTVADAGATWWQEWIEPGDLAMMRESIRRGPLRID